LAGRAPSRASPLPQFDRGTSAGDWLTSRAPSRASSAPTKKRESRKAEKPSDVPLRSPPLIRPSVSSPSALDLAFDLPAPSAG
jgi:hypothetical protein